MNYLDENYKVTLISCTECQGTGQMECCGGHMCPGTTKCHACNGKGERLSDGDRKLKKQLEKLMEYK